MTAAKRTVKSAPAKPNKQPNKPAQTKSTRTHQSSTSSKPPTKSKPQPSLNRHSKPSFPSARPLYNNVEEDDDVISSSSLSDDDNHDHMDIDPGQEEISEEDDQVDDYQPKGSLREKRPVGGSRAGRSEGTRSGGHDPQADSTRTNKQGGVGKNKGRNGLVESDMDVDEQEREDGYGAVVRYDGHGEQEQAEEDDEEEEEEEYTQKEPIDLQLNLLQKRLLEGNAKHKTKRSQDRLILLDRSYARFKKEMEDVTVDVDIGSGAEIDEDVDEGEEGVGRGRGSGKEIGWNELMKQTRSIIKTIETMSNEMEVEFPINPAETYAGRKGREDCWTMMNDDIKGYKGTIEPILEMLKLYVNEDIIGQIEAIEKTGEEIKSFSGLLNEASKRAGKFTRRKMREQYEIAQRNVTAKSYIDSVAKIMGVDLTPFRD